MPGGVAKKKKRSSPTYASYIHKVLQEVSPKNVTGVTISSKTIQLLNLMLNDLESRMADKAFALAMLDKKSTLGSAHVKTAANILLPNELARHASGEMTKALNKFTAVAA